MFEKSLYGEYKSYIPYWMCITVQWEKQATTVNVSVMG